MQIQYVALGVWVHCGGCAVAVAVAVRSRYWVVAVLGGRGHHRGTACATRSCPPAALTPTCHCSPLQATAGCGAAACSVSGCSGGCTQQRSRRGGPPAAHLSHHGRLRNGFEHQRLRGGQALQSEEDNEQHPSQHRYSANTDEAALASRVPAATRRLCSLSTPNEGLTRPIA